MINSFKFNINDPAYIVFASFANGKKHLYEKTNVTGRFIDNKKVKKYFIARENSTENIICPEELLLNENELKLKLKMGSKLI